MEKRSRIMVVDDDRNLLELISCILELEGYDVSVTADSSSVLALLKEYRPDLVLLDIIMPKLDGFQVLYLIRQHSNVPVIMLTAKGEVNSLEKAVILGADDYVRKPFSTRVLMARIEAKLRRVEQRIIALKESTEEIHVQ